MGKLWDPGSGFLLARGAAAQDIDRVAFYEKTTGESLWLMRQPEVFFVDI